MSLIRNFPRETDPERTCYIEKKLIKVYSGGLSFFVGNVYFITGYRNKYLNYGYKKRDSGVEVTQCITFRKANIMVKNIEKAKGLFRINFMLTYMQKNS